MGVSLHLDIMKYPNRLAWFDNKFYLSISNNYGHLVLNVVIMEDNFYTCIYKLNYIFDITGKTINNNS